MARITRRQLLKYGAAGGATLLLPLRVGLRQALAQVPGGTLPPGGIPKYVTPLVIPPAMPRTAGPPAVRGVDYYEIAVRQCRRHMLPQSMGLEPTTVWSDGSGDDPGICPRPGTSLRDSPALAPFTSSSGPRPSGCLGRRGRREARSSSTTTTSGRRRCGTTTTRWG